VLLTGLVKKFKHDVYSVISLVLPRTKVLLFGGKRLEDQDEAIEITSVLRYTRRSSQRF
jgi:hypothetical protein